MAVTFGTMALLSLPFSRFITSGFGKRSPIHDALGPVERLVRPIAGWVSPVEPQPTARGSREGFMFGTELPRPIEAPSVSSSPESRFQHSSVPSATFPIRHDRRDSGGDGPRCARRLHERGREHHNPRRR